MQTTNTDSLVQRLTEAFAKDGFTVTRTVEFQGRLGVVAENAAASKGGPGGPREPKRAFYVEGNSYQMGFLLGLMAEPQVSRMAVDYAQDVIFAFFGAQEASLAGTDKLADFIKELIVRIVYELSKSMRPDIPDEYIQELDGLYAGCLKANPKSKVTPDNLWALNFGIDCLLSHIYTGKLFVDKKVPAPLLRLPLMCNAYSLSGAAVQGGGHYFGRDFMFPTANVFQDVACMIVYNPDPAQGAALPFVSQTAPGIIGTMAGMNRAGVAIGTDMLPSALCNPSRPGFNSLLLLRDCMHHCRSVDEVVERMANTQRGVSWLYPVAGYSPQAGSSACFIEAGMKVDGPFPYLDQVTPYYKPFLPSVADIEAMQKHYAVEPPRAGLVARRAGYPVGYPLEYIKKYNPGLCKAFDNDGRRKLFTGLEDVVQDLVDIIDGKASHEDLLKIVEQQIQDVFVGVQCQGVDNNYGEDGFITPSPKGKSCPGPYYFAPQREGRLDEVLVTNSAISPEMRLTSMNDWLALVSAGAINDIQWRYDALNDQLYHTLQQKGAIGEEDAWCLINFLSPDTRLPAYDASKPVYPSTYRDYYNPGLKKDYRTIQVEGSISLFDLKAQRVKSLFGYFGDDPVTICLPNYLAAGL